MSPRALALLLAALAAGLTAGWAWPARARVEAVRRETELAQQQGQRAGRRTARPAAAPASTGEGLRRLRRQVLALAEARPVGGVQLEVLAARGTGRGAVRLVAEGSFQELSRLAGDLAGTPGLALARVELSPRGESSRLELEAVAW